jgi:CubicO group peptidase (beta-lactamase class C family)
MTKRTHMAVTRRALIRACLGAPALLLTAAAGRSAAAPAAAPQLRRRVAARAAGLDQLHSVIVGRRGRVLLAEAFRGPPLDRPVNVKSVSKTLVATLAGIAIDRGLISGVGATLGDTAPELIPSGADPRVAGITIAQLLTMQAGLERTSGPNYGRWVQSPDWVAFALSRPFEAEPGTTMLYSTGSYHVLGAVLSRRAGRSLLDLARAWLGDPLDVAVPGWTRDPQGFYMGGNNMALSPLALFRFAEMWRNGGVWADARVLGADWIAQSWTPRTRSPFSGDAYGYGWFLTELDGHRVAYARGYGGQMLYVVPALDLTVVVTSDPSRPARSGGYVGELNALLAEDIIPAAQGG